MKYFSIARTKNWLPGFITIFLACLLIVIHVRLNGYAYDDAYIHFRVVRNLFETGAPYYNLGEMVKVSTSSGWILFLTLLYSLAHLIKIENNFPLLIGIVNALLSIGGMLVYTALLQALQPKPLSLPFKMLFQISFLALLLPASIGLMETPLALLVAGLGIYCLSRSQPSGFALLGIVATIRLELSIVLALAALFCLLRGQFRILPIIACTVLGALPPILFDFYFYHTLLPHSIAAKSIVYSRVWSQPALEILITFFPALSIHSQSFYLAIACLSLSILLIAAVTVLIQWKESRNFWPVLFCLWCLLIGAGYTLGRAMIFEWYSPLYTIPFLMMCVFCSISADLPRTRIIRGFLILLVLFSTGSMLTSVYASLNHPNAFAHFMLGSRVKSYLSIGAILNEDYPGATLLSSEVGGLGYSFRGEIFDAGGLASPAALAFHPLKIPEQRINGSVGAIPPAYVKTTNPDLIVTYDSLGQALMSDAVIQQYNEIRLPAYLPEDARYSDSQEIWGGKYLRLYIRKDLPISARIRALGQ